MSQVYKHVVNHNKVTFLTCLMSISDILLFSSQALLPVTCHFTESGHLINSVFSVDAKSGISHAIDYDIVNL